MGEHLILGNTAESISGSRRHKWTFYVRGATDLVDSVTVRLHPTFKNPVRTCKEAPFEFECSGWGTFNIDVLVKWKTGGKLLTEWSLQFEQPDASRQVAVPPQAARARAEQVRGPVEVRRTDESHHELRRTDESHEELEEAPAGYDSESSHSATLRAWSGGMEPESEPEAELSNPDSEEDPPPEPPQEGLLRAPSDGVEDVDPARSAMCNRLRSTPFLQHTDPRFMHGRGYDGPMQPPKVTWRSNKPPRKDHDCPKWLTATEFEDAAEVTAVKVRQLAILMRMSRKTVAYTGAGISAAVIGQAALSGQNTVGWKGDTRAAPPTFTHHALGLLGREGLLHGWVQQNHDGLPQKAGFPQERINEIHGSWYDPSNPVVKYSGSLHSRSYPWMREDAQTADLVLVLGTSLGGLNADQVATSTAERSLLPPAPRAGELVPGAWVRVRRRKGLVTAVHADDLEVRFQDDSDDEVEQLHDPVALPKSTALELLPPVGGGLGTVIMNLQQTAQDGLMTLRLFGKSDDILRMLLQVLGLALPRVGKPMAWPKASRVLVPYNAEGRRVQGGRQMWLDLRKGQAVRITPGHNIQGAKQPAYMHIGAPRPITIKGETRQPAPGNGVVVNRCEKTSSFVLQIEGAQMRLGIWWLETAARGAVEVLPVVNREPAFED